jgi:hypothetical protein
MHTLIEYTLSAVAPSKVPIPADHPRACGIASAGTPEQLRAHSNSQATPATATDDRASAWRVTKFDQGEFVNLFAGAAELVAQLVEAAGLAGASRLTLPIATIATDGIRAYADALHQAFAQIEALLPTLERGAVTLCLPAGRDGFFMSPPELREFIDRLASPYVAADVAGIKQRCDRAGTRDWVETLGPRVGVLTADARAELVAGTGPGDATGPDPLDALIHAVTVDRQRSRPTSRQSG